MSLTERIAQIEAFIENDRMSSLGQLQTQNNTELFLYWIGLLLRRQIQIDALKYERQLSGDLSLVDESMKDRPR